MVCHQSRGCIVFVVKCTYFNAGTTMFFIEPSPQPTNSAFRRTSTLPSRLARDCQGVRSTVGILLPVGCYGDGDSCKNVT